MYIPNKIQIYKIMHSDEFSNWRSTNFFSDSPVWRSAFEWIEAKAGSAEEGYHYDFPDGKMFARVMSYSLKNRDAARYEHHIHTIDLQYTISGAEGIEYSPLHLLKNEGEYLQEKDFQFLQTPAKTYGRIDNHAGHFCVLWPQDAHMPQLRVDGFEHVRKVVVKIPIDLVTGTNQ